MYLSLPFNHVVALDARNGKELWRYEHKRRVDKMCCGPANRGVAVAYGKVFIGTVDARLIALDQKTGKLVWDTPLVDDLAAKGEATERSLPTIRCASNACPAPPAWAPTWRRVVYKGKVIIGITGVGYGLHLDSDRPGAPVGAVVGIAGDSQRAGFYAAFDAATGKRIWQFDSTPATGWEGEFRTTTPTARRWIATSRSEKAALADNIATHGSAAADPPGPTPAIDPELGLVYRRHRQSRRRRWTMLRGRATTSTPCRSSRSTSRRGKLRWYYQQVPHDMWGLDVASPPVLFDAEVDGTPVPAVGQASKTGWFYVLDRRDGKLLYKSEAFVPQHNQFKRPTTEGIEIAPGAAGGASWSPVSYDARTGLVLCGGHSHADALHGEGNSGHRRQTRSALYDVGSRSTGRRWGTLTALDTRAQRQDQLASEDRRNRWSAVCSPRPAIWSSPEKATATSTHSMRRTASGCGSSTAAPASMRRRSPTSWMACSTSPSLPEATRCSATGRATP